jgi:hypothetical protein
MKKLLGLSLFILLISCTETSVSDFTYVKLSEISTLDSSETLYGFDDKYPVSVCLNDSFAFIIQIKADTCLTAINTKNKQIHNSFGYVGHGPKDVISPNFITTIDRTDILVEDGNTKKIMKIEMDSCTKIFTLKKAMEYPDKIFMSGENSFSNNFIVGRRVNNGGKMFYIYNRNTESIIDIDYYPVIKNLKHDPNYIYAPCIASNEKKDRIIVGMYFFDMIHLYNLAGDRIKTFCFSENSISSFNSKDLMRDIENCSAGFIRTFPTQDYCYLLRILGNRIVGDTNYMLFQINWEGELINAYKIQDKIEGQFYIDEKEKKMYAIRNRVESVVSELYEIISYPLK